MTGINNSLLGNLQIAFDYRLLHIACRPIPCQQMEPICKNRLVSDSSISMQIHLVSLFFFIFVFSLLLVSENEIINQKKIDSFLFRENVIVVDDHYLNMGCYEESSRFIYHHNYLLYVSIV
jgi:hypothetical protein